MYYCMVAVYPRPKTGGQEITASSLQEELIAGYYPVYHSKHVDHVYREQPYIASSERAPQFHEG